MQTRWNESAAREFVNEFERVHGEAFALRLYSARLIGSQPTLVLHGGGNVSIKGHAIDILGNPIEVIHVKASGWDLESLDAEGMPAMELTPLRRLRSLPALDDETMVRQVRRALLDPAAPTPSIETLLHAFLPHRFVDHSHADAVIILTNQPDGMKHLHKALGSSVAIVEYVRPGFDLAKSVAETVEQNPHVEGVVLMQHGLITFGDDARTSYQRHINIVTRCEEYLAKKTAAGKTKTIHSAPAGDPSRAACIAPVLRGALIRASNKVPPHVLLEFSDDPQILRALASPFVQSMAETGPLTADHLIRTKPWPMLLDAVKTQPAAWRTLIESSLDAYARRYESYCRRHAAQLPLIDPTPRVIWVPGVGVFASGPSPKEAHIALEISRQTLLSKAQAFELSGFASLPEDHLFEMEYRGLQLAKVSGANVKPLSGQIVAISGAAGAIGAGIAEACANAGACIVAFDLDRTRLDALVAEVTQRHGENSAIGIVMDVTSEADVAAGFEQASLWHGGFDVIVVNAGIAHVAPIVQLSASDFRRLMEVNAVGSFLFLREGARCLKAQGVGGNIILISSKNVPAPGKDFAAYSASKAAAHQLARVAALELAPDAIRVNLIAPDGVFGDKAHPSGLWTSVGPDRAKSRGLRPEELPEYYRTRNLLKVRVTPNHVGQAVVFLAATATATTGAVLPIDGGLPEAFPR